MLYCVNKQDKTLEVVDYTDKALNIWHIDEHCSKYYTDNLDKAAEVLFKVAESDFKFIEESKIEVC